MVQDQSTLVVQFGIAVVYGCVFFLAALFCISLERFTEIEEKLSKKIFSTPSFSFERELDFLDSLLKKYHRLSGGILAVSSLWILINFLILSRYLL